MAPIDIEGDIGQRVALSMGMRGNLIQHFSIERLVDCKPFKTRDYPGLGAQGGYHDPQFPADPLLINIQINSHRKRREVDGISRPQFFVRASSARIRPGNFDLGHDLAGL